MAFEGQINLNIVSRFMRKGIKRARKSLGSLQNSSQEVGRKMGGMRKSVNSTNNRLNRMGAASQSVWRNQQTMKNQMADVTKRTKQQNKAMQKGESGARKFSFELLGLMFAGMALKKAMFGLLRPAFKAVGVFDVFSSTLKVLFLPIALEVLDVVLDFQSFIFGLDESTRSLIGRFVLAAGVLGTFMFIAAQAGLAVESLGIFMAKGGTAAKILTSPLSTIGGALSTITGLLPGVNAITAGLGAVATFLAGLAGGFLAVTTVAKRFGKKVALVFGGIIAAVALWVATVVAAPALIAAAVGIAIGALLGIAWTFRDELIDILIGAFELAVTQIKTYIDGIINLVKGLATVIAGVMTLNGDMIVKGLKEIFKGLYQVLIKPFVNFGNAIKSVLPDWVVDILDAGAGAISGAMSGAMDFVGLGGGGKTKSPSRRSNAGGGSTTVVNQENNFQGGFSESKKNLERETRKAGERGSRGTTPFFTG